MPSAGALNGCLEGCALLRVRIAACGADGMRSVGTEKDHQIFQRGLSSLRWKVLGEWVGDSVKRYESQLVCPREMGNFKIVLIFPWPITVALDPRGAQAHLRPFSASDMKLFLSLSIMAALPSVFDLPSTFLSPVFKLLVRVLGLEESLVSWMTKAPGYSKIRSSSVCWQNSERTRDHLTTWACPWISVSCSPKSKIYKSHPRSYQGRRGF